MSTKMQLEWRRRQVFELNSDGQSQTEISRILQISESTISRDLDYLRASKDTLTSGCEKSTRNAWLD
ncbi:MAG: sigma factor-like helix-turn-helix DNA-binding protein [Nitrososphaeraceae archaeon]